MSYHLSVARISAVWTIPGTDFPSGITIKLQCNTWRREFFFHISKRLYGKGQQLRVDVVAVAVRQAESQGQDGHFFHAVLQIAFRFIREFLPADGVHGDFFRAVLQHDGIVIAVDCLVENAQAAHEFIANDVMTRDVLGVEGPDIVGKVNPVVAVDVVQREDDLRVAVLPSGVEDCVVIDLYLFYGYNGTMIISFRDKETAKVYQQEFSKKLPQSIQRLALRKLMMIDNASSVNDLRIPPANHLEQLSGQRKDEYSIRINKQYRICFRVDSGNQFYDVQIEDYH